MRAPWLSVLSVALGVIVGSAALYSYWYFRPGAPVVPAFAETVPIPNVEDAADDPAIFVNPLDPARSLILGTDKEGGLSIYDLAGAEVQRFDNGPQNNVDLRPIQRGDREDILATTSTNDYAKVFVYRVDPASARLERLLSSTIKTGVEAEGLCMYRSAVSKKTYVFVNGDDEVTDEDGIVEQYELAWDPGAERFDARLVRRIDVGGDVEGCVADDGYGAFFISEEDTGVWRYGAEPDAGETRELVERLGTGGRIRYNAEGLAIYDSGEGGYLVVSSQGSDDFLLYDRRAPHAYRGGFQIGAGAGVDAVSHTDGIDVVASPLPGLAEGLFVAQDDENDGQNQNFKLVRWSDIRAATEIP